MSAITAKLRLISIDWLQLAMFLLTLAGLAVSGYLMWGYATPGAELACGGSHGCDTVKDSVYASFLGIPLPFIGLISYSILLLLIISLNQAAFREQGWTPYISLAIFGFSLVGVLYSAYLTYLELFVIYAICRWCVASAIIMIAIFLVSVFNLRKNNQSYTVEG